MSLAIFALFVYFFSMLRVIMTLLSHHIDGRPEKYVITLQHNKVEDVVDI